MFANPMCAIGVIAFSRTKKYKGSSNSWKVIGKVLEMIFQGYFIYLTMAKNYHWSLLQEAFKKASHNIQERGGTINMTQCALELSSYISEDFNFPITDRAIRNYWNDLNENKEGNIPQQKVLDGLSQYLGFEDYLDYVNRINGSPSVWIKKRWKPLFLTTMILVAISFGTYKYITLPKCMTWIEDHYEKVPCDIDSAIEGKIKPFDSNTFLHFKKVHPDSIKTFFSKKREPLIWYGKNLDGKYEYFTALGFHPETGKSLKPITPYIIDKYIKKSQE